jgi:hypothetical protein
MASVVIIGFGCIGKHHYESCLKNKFIKKIYIIEKQNSQLKNYNFFFKEKKIEVFNTITYIKEIIFLTIIATDSLNRYKTTLDFLKKNNTKNIIFEKFLFNKISEYNFISRLIKKKEIKAYVNCNRRLSKDYQSLKKKYKEKILGISVIGNSWGLLSNSIHFIDLFFFLTNIKQLKLHSFDFEKKILSKRKGYAELQSTIIFKSQNCFLSISDSKKNKENKILIHFEKKILNILENKNISYTHSLISNKIFKKNKIQNTYVSETTSKAIDNIVKYDDAGLVNYEESALQHKLLLISLKKILKVNNFSFDEIAIT